MRPTNNMKQTIGQDTTETPRPLAIVLRKSRSKAPGTRIGILQNWRGTSDGKGLGRLGKTLRDGR